MIPNDILRLIFSYSTWKRYIFLCESFSILPLSIDIKNSLSSISSRTLIDEVCKMEREYVDVVLIMYELGLRWTPNAINYACKGGHLNIVKFLHTKSTLHHTAIESACVGGHLQIVKYLHKNGIKLTKQILQMACYHGHIPIIKYFIKNGFAITQTDIYFAEIGGKYNLASIL